MTTPFPSTPTAMVALTELYQALWSGRIPNVAPGQPFWARYADSSGLIAGGLARLWTAGDPEITINMPTPNSVQAFTAWINSGECNRSFWAWMSRNGYHV